jgi:hypothetical protein
MMSNSWRDPVWRGAFLLLARAVSTNGECDTPAPPDGTGEVASQPVRQARRVRLGVRHRHAEGHAVAAWLAARRVLLALPHADQLPRTTSRLRTVTVDPKTGLEHAPPDVRFNPTSDNKTGMAFATLEEQFRNTESGKTGIFCAICHSFAATRDTPFHNYERSGTEYVPCGRPRVARRPLLPIGAAGPVQRRRPVEAQPRLLDRRRARTGCRRTRSCSPERFGPMAANDAPTPTDATTAPCSATTCPTRRSIRRSTRAITRRCSCAPRCARRAHDVTNALPIKNTLGKWAGGFPIERTYTEWVNSRYADRPGNKFFDPKFKRDCQHCHMQQDYGQPRHRADSV